MNRCSRAFAVTFIALSPLAAPGALGKTWGELAGGGCENLVKEVVFLAVKDVGGEIVSPIDSFVIDPIVEMVTTPTEDRAKAVALKLIEGGLKLVSKPFGIAFDGGRIFIGGSTYAIAEVVDAAHMQQVQAMVDGAVSFNNPYSRVSFWDSSALVHATPPITRDNIAETVDSEERLHDLWQNKYGRPLKDLFAGDPGVATMLDAAWPVLRQYWASKHAQMVLAKFQLSLLEHARKANAAQGACGSATSNPGGSHFEMVNIDDEVAKTAPEWQKTVGNGSITLMAPFGHAECVWNSPPRSVALEGFDLTMKVSATSAPKSRLATNIAFTSGFDSAADKGKTSAAVDSQNGVKADDAVTVHLKPKTFASLKDGDPIFLTIGGCNAGNVTYVYAFRK